MGNTIGAVIGALIGLGIGLFVMFWVWSLIVAVLKALFDFSAGHAGRTPTEHAEHLADRATDRLLENDK